MSIYSNESGGIKDLSGKKDFDNGFVINGVKYLGRRDADTSVTINNYKNYKFIVVVPIHINTDTAVRTIVIIEVESITPDTVTSISRNIGWNYSVNAGRGGAYITFTKNSDNTAISMAAGSASADLLIFGVY